MWRGLFSFRSANGSGFQRRAHSSYTTNDYDQNDISMLGRAIHDPASEDLLTLSGALLLRLKKRQARRGARGLVMTDERRRMAFFQAQPEGLGPVFRLTALSVFRLACETSVLLPCQSIDRTPTSMRQLVSTDPRSTPAH
jgi:hypothetical protein